MSSMAIGKPTSLKNMGRPHQFIDYSSVGRISEDEKPARLSDVLPQKFSTGSIWAIPTGASSNIWAPDNAARNSKTETSRPSNVLRKSSFKQMEDERNPKLSGQPVITVEDRDYRWNPHNSYPDTYAEAVSPTSATHSGSVSPVRHRGSSGNGLSNATRATESLNTSPYFSRQTPTQGFGNRAPAQLSAEQFTYSHHYASKPPVDNAANMALYRRDSVTNTDSLKSKHTPRDFQIQTGTTQPSSLYDNSLPPSRGSDYHDLDHAPDYFAIHRGSRGESQLEFNTRLSVSNNTPLYPSHLSNSYEDAIQALSKGTSSLNLDNRTPSNIYSNSSTYDKHTLGSNNSMNNFVRKNMQTSTSHSPPTRSNFGNGRQVDVSDHAAVDHLALSNRRSYAMNNTADHMANHNLPAVHQYPIYAAYNGQLYGPSYAPQYTPGISRQQETQLYRNMNDQYGFQGVTPYYSTGPPARNLPRDVCHGLRSQILEDFRNNTKSNKAFTLRDVYGHIVEFSGDQHGSRWIQQKLEVANSDEKSRVFEEILVNINQLTTDIFGNYVIQKLYERGDQVQKKLLAQQMRGHVRELSTHSYGCRVVQTALDHVLADQQIEIVKELQKDILKCVKDQNGNHVVQKAIEKVPLEHIQFIIDAFKGQVYALSTHNYGCRVMQRMLSHCDQPFLLEELFACAPALIAHEYGNYVIQHIIQQGKTEDRARIIQLVNQQLLTFCKSKFASNVVECAMVHSTDEQRRSIMKTMISLSSDSSNTLQILMKDQFGNYVVQKLLSQLQSADREQLIEAIKPQIVQLKRYNSGKQIAAIEKLVFGDSFGTDGSAAPTPQLTTSQNSPQSSTASSFVASSNETSTTTKAEPKVKVVNA